MSSPVDYFDLRLQLTEEEVLSWDTTYRFVEREWLQPKPGKGKPLVVECTREHRFPKELVEKMAELGFLGATLPEKYGGAGIGPVAYGLLNYELERGDSALRSFVSVTNGLVCFPIFTFGSEKQKQKWLPKLCRGEIIGCFGLTESGGGSNPLGQMKTTAVEDGNSFCLNGEKQWITNGTIADIALVWAKFNNEVRGFVVEKETPGFRAEPIGGKLSLLASDSANLVFSDCRIPKDAMLPDARGIKTILQCLNEARYGIAWGAVGAAAGCYEIALEYAKERVVFPPKPIAAYQLTQNKLVDMLGKITWAQFACLQLGRLKERDRLRHQQISLAKRENVSMARDVARVAREILGAPGITDEYAPMRHLINAETLFTYEGSHDIQGLIVGKDITGLNAFG